MRSRPLKPLATFVDAFAEPELDAFCPGWYGMLIADITRAREDAENPRFKGRGKGKSGGGCGRGDNGRGGPIPPRHQVHPPQNHQIGNLQNQQRPVADGRRFWPQPIPIRPAPARSYQGAGAPQKHGGDRERFGDVFNGSLYVS